MAQGLGTETGQDKTPGRRRPPRSRELAGLAIGIAAGLGIALGWVVPALNPPASHSPAPASSDRPFQVAGSAGLDPAALDAEWLAYSDHSTCADWAGGDGVSAIRLNSAQLAWFFSDTSIGPAGPAIGFTQLSGFTHNSLVIQTTTGPGSSFVTMTGGGACNRPGGPGNAAPVVGAPPAVPGGPSDRYWEEDGLAAGGMVVKFYNHYRAGIEPYVPLGTVIASYPVSQLSAAGHGSRYGAVARPSLISLPSWTPPDGGSAGSRSPGRGSPGRGSPGRGSPVLWGAAVLRVENMVYVYGTQSPRVSVPDRRLYLARVPVSELTRFAAWRFYTGDGQWAAGQAHARPVQPAASTLEVSSGFSVVAAGGRYWLIQAGAAVGDPDIDAYPAATPWGPFDASARRLLYRDPSVGLDAAHSYRIMYEARAELALSAGGTLMISYNVNSEAVTTGCKPMSAFTNTVILPRFVAVPLAAFGPGTGAPAGAAARGVTSGPPDYPSIVAQDPAQWFDAWAYPGDCPPVPAVASARARPTAGQVTLSWPGSGLDITYRVYLRGPGKTGRAPVSSTAAGPVTVTGLRPGSYTARVVPVNFYQHTGRAAEVTFTVP